MKLDGPLSFFRDQGCIAFVRRVAAKMLRPLGLDESARSQQQVISRELLAMTGGVVQVGPLRGFKLDQSARWNLEDRASMLLGLYELEVLQALLRYGENYEVLIDVGAADGYYAVGCVASGLFDSCVAFEQDRKSRELIGRNAHKNGISEKIVVHGVASSGSVSAAVEAAGGRAMILMDIEGGEFGLLGSDTIAELSQCTLVVEIHETREADPQRALEDLHLRLSSHFEVREIRTGSRDLSASEFLESLPDHKRWLVCSEGRTRLGRWWIMTPKVS